MTNLSSALKRSNILDSDYFVRLIRGCWMNSRKGLMPGLFVESVGKEIIAEKLLNWKLRCQNSLYMV